MPVLNYVNQGGRPRNRDTILSTRPNRKPLNGANDILTVHNLPRGLHARWVNDEDDRIYRFMEAGYEFLTSKGIMVGDRTVDMESDAEKNGSVVSKRVGSGKDGRPLIAYLMVIEEEFYEEDQKRKYKKIDQTEQELRRPKEGMYGSIEINRG